MARADRVGLLHKVVPLALTLLCPLERGVDFVERFSNAGQLRAEIGNAPGRRLPTRSLSANRGRSVALLG
jgi:hypothetical protein